MFLVLIKRSLRGSRAAGVLGGALGIALSVLAFFAIQAAEQQTVRKAYEDAALNLQAAIRLGLQHSIDQVESVGALFESSNNVTREQFRVFSRQLLTAAPGIQALEWIPRVSSARRADYERAARRTFPRFEITERQAQGIMLRARAREEYFPVYYVEPYAGNEVALGFDLASNPTRLEALTRSRDTGNVVATGRITLVQEKATQQGFLLFRPVYRTGTPHDTVQQKHDNLLGFALGVFRIGDVLEAAAHHLRPAGITVSLSDDSAPAPERFLGRWPATAPDDPPQASQTREQPVLRHTVTFDMGGRRWSLVMTPAEGRYDTATTWRAWSVLAVGLLLSLLWMAYLETARRHARRQSLSDEAKRAAEKKLADILNSVDNGILSISAATREVQHLNPAAARIFGRPLAALDQDKILWFDAIHPEDRSRVKARLAAAPETGGWTDDCRIVRPDGEIRWLEARAKFVPGTETEGARIDVIANDITERKQAEAQMRLLAGVVEQTADALMITDRDGIVQYVNPAYEAVTGYTRAEAVGKKPNLVKSGRHDRAFYERLWGTILRGEVFRDRFINRKKDGSLYYVDKIITPLKDETGRITHFISTGRDVTPQVKAEEALRESESSLAQAQHIAHVGNWDWDIVANTLRWSDEIYRIFGLTPQQFGATYEAFLNSVHPGDRQSVIDAVNQALHEKRPYRIDHRIVRPDRTERIVHEQGEVTFDENGKATRMIGTVQDVTEQRHTQEQLHYLAHYDPLSGLPNRVLLQDRLRHAMREAQRSERLVAVMFLDLDRFKTVNDTLGHDVGDALLKSVAERLAAGLRPGDTVSRLGGDEFAIVLANVAHVDDVTGVARKIVNQFLSPFRLGGRDLFASPSIGITLYPLDEKEPENLLKDADIAMYRAKELGGNTFQFYTPALNARAARRLELETGLRRALEKGEFLLHYQPLVDMQTGRVRGMEALLRWQHPEFGLIPPLDFIPLAEETGLIIPIGEWVLKTACAQIKAWHATGFPALQVAVNLSSKQLRDKNLIVIVKQALEAAGLEARYLDLELTESVLMRDMELAVTILKELKAVGVSFSLDDFGTGYSSLSYLKHFPIDYLKIDHSFVHDILTDPVGAGLVKAIIAMAHTLDIKVIAEGVETHEQLAFLREEDCDITQGYFCSPPVDAATFTELLRDWNQLRAGKCSVQDR